MNSNKHICRACKNGHSYYKKQLPSSVRWCRVQNGLKKNVKNCDDFEIRKEER